MAPGYATYYKMINGIKWWIADDSTTTSKNEAQRIVSDIKRGGYWKQYKIISVKPGVYAVIMRGITSKQSKEFGPGGAAKGEKQKSYDKHYDND